MAGKVIEEGDVVRFTDSSEDEGRESLYRVIEVEGDEVIIELVCNHPMAPQATAKIGELTPAEEDE
jgi:FKBP-type peptidyl-prolyl cis-trans isomerase 2